MIQCPKCKEKSKLERSVAFGIGLYYRCYNCNGEFLQNDVEKIKDEE